jgi:hypothetical protein
MTKSTRATLLWVMALLMPSLTAHAERRAIAVVAPASSKLTALTEAQVRDYFLGNAQLLPTGELATPVDQAKDAPITAEFYESLAGMSPKELSVHWAKKIFTGRGTPPTTIEGGDAKVKEFLKSKGTAIGYVYSDAVDGSVKVLLTVGR